MHEERFLQPLVLKAQGHGIGIGSALVTTPPLCVHLSRADGIMTGVREGEIHSKTES